MKQSGVAILRKFYLSAVLIILIIGISALSIFYAVDLLVHNYVVEVILSAFISLLFGLMYIFLMNTFAKDPKANKSGIKSLSNLTRMLFVVFMGFILSKPIEVWLLKNKMDSAVEVYRHHLMKIQTEHIGRLADDDIARLLAEAEKHKQMQQKQIANPAPQETDLLEKQINFLQGKKTLALDIARERIYNSDFFLYRVRIASRSWIAWLCCLLVVTLFVMPGFLIYSISDNDNYFKLKKEYENRIILMAYDSFIKKYTFILGEKYGIKTTVYSVFDDPPFNTLRKINNISYLSEQDFISKYLNRN